MILKKEVAFTHCVSTPLMCRTAVKNAFMIFENRISQLCNRGSFYGPLRHIGYRNTVLSREMLNKEQSCWQKIYTFYLC